LDFVKELNWARRFAAHNPKNYQVWHHRACLLELLGEPLDELVQMIGDFQQEPKNYHAWQYRQWILKRFGGSVEDEMMLIDELLRLDMYNNSAWNHRWFIRKTLQCRTDWHGVDLAVVEEKLAKDPKNSSAVNYKSWLLSQT